MLSLTFKHRRLFLPLFFLIACSAAQTTEFTYQGKLIDNSIPANANYDFEFQLYAAPTGGAPIGTRTRLGVPVTNGVFTVRLDFLPAAFNGSDRFLEIAVKPAGSPDPFTTLSPRQQITYAPYSFRSLNSITADTSTNSLQLGGVAASQFTQTNDARLFDDRNPLPNSANYIQNNPTTQQTGSFNIIGNGTASVFNSTTQYNIGGQKVLSVAGTNNVFAGVDAGLLNNSGNNNAFFGRRAGIINTTGSFNSFFGSNAGDTNTTGNANSFFGYNAGAANTTASNNSFFGQGAGFKNTDGDDNTFIGYNAGLNNTTGQENTFVGSFAGQTNTEGLLNTFVGWGAGAANTTASANSFFGNRAGRLNTTGSSNSFFGDVAGDVNTTGDHNSFFGQAAGRDNTEGTENAFFGASAGFSNTSGNSNSFFGRDAGFSNTTSTDNSFFGYQAGQNSVGDSLTPGLNSFFGSQAGKANTTGNHNSFFGKSAGDSNTSGNNNVFFGYYAGSDNTMGIGNVFVGANAGNNNVTGAYNTIIGDFANVGSGNLSYATAIGGGAVVSSSDTIQLGRSDRSDGVLIPGLLTLPNLAGGGSLHLCRNALDRVSDCSSSLRYKTNVQAFFGGLDIVNRLRPVTFNWKEGGMNDVGFAAEEVQQIEPLLATYNKQGQVEGVKYDRLNVVLVNAIKEQQKQIEELKSIKLENAELKVQLAAVLARLEQLEKQGGQRK